MKILYEKLRVYPFYVILYFFCEFYVEMCMYPQESARKELSDMRKD